MATSLRRQVKGLALASGLYGPLWWLRGWLSGYAPTTLLANRRWRRDHAAELPTPPPRLIYTVINTYDIAAFVATGQRAAAKITSALDQAGLGLDRCRDVLDFGCGCGRIIRHFADRRHARWHGCDYNPELVAWCQVNLSFADFAVNALAPPLPYPDGAFDLVYANSVFTHLDDDLGSRWLAELRRVLRPGGALVATTHGEAWRSGLTPAEQERFDAGASVIRSDGSAGSNLCETYHPPAAFRAAAAAHFARALHFAKGNATAREQDIWVLEVGPD